MTIETTRQEAPVIEDLQKHIGVLERRASWLKERAETSTNPRAAAFDREEAAAGRAGIAALRFHARALAGEPLAAAALAKLLDVLDEHELPGAIEDAADEAARALPR